MDKSQIELAKKLLERNGYQVTRVNDLTENDQEMLAGYDVNSPIVFTSYNEFEGFMKEVISE